MANTPGSAFFPANRLLSLLPEASKTRLGALAEAVTFKPKQVIYKVRGALDYVYFPASGILSAMTVMDDGSSIEVATIGKEGMTGLTAFIGGSTSPYEVMVQVAGEGLRIATDAFRKEVDRSAALRDIFIRYHTAYSMQVSYSVACNGLHKIEQRCCRWLLMTHDRVGSNELQLTHEFLAIMLGVRRASVTEVLQPIQATGAIHNGRGTIEIVDRAKLEKMACECYKAVRDEFARQFGSE